MRDLIFLLNLLIVIIITFLIIIIFIKIILIPADMFLKGNKKREYDNTKSGKLKLIVLIVSVLALMIVFFYPVKIIPSEKDIQKIYILSSTYNDYKVINGEKIKSIVNELDKYTYIRNPFATLSGMGGGGEWISLMIEYTQNNEKKELTIMVFNKDNDYIRDLNLQVFQILDSKDLYSNLDNYLVLQD